MKFISFFMLGVPVYGSFSGGAPRSKGLVVCKSNQDFKSTRRTLLRSINKEPDTFFFEEVDFRQGAKDGGKTILPNTLVVFGNPSLGARVMEEERELAVDLPKKMQIFEDEKGNVFIAYSPVEYLEKRYGGLKAVDSVLDEISDLYSRLAATTADRNSCNIMSHPVTGLNQIKEGQGLVTKKSDFNFKTTWKRVLRKIENNKRSLDLFFTVDHELNDPAGELGPTKLAVFGNIAEIGVPLIESNQAVVSDLPLKVLVWEDEKERTFVTVNMPEYIEFRHDLSGVDEIIDGLDELFKEIVNFATKDTRKK